LTVDQREDGKVLLKSVMFDLCSCEVMAARADCLGLVTSSEILSILSKNVFRRSRQSREYSLKNLKGGSTKRHGDADRALGRAAGGAVRLHEQEILERLAGQAAPVVETRNVDLEPGQVRGGLHVSLIPFLRCIGIRKLSIALATYRGRIMAADKRYHPIVKVGFIVQMLIGGGFLTVWLWNGSATLWKFGGGLVSLDRAEQPYMYWLLIIVIAWIMIGMPIRSMLKGPPQY
jgi:hypothetical protein